MKTYLRNVKAAWKIYKDGRWPKPNRHTTPMSIYRWLFKYTLKYIQRSVV